MAPSHRERLIEGAISCIQEKGISETTTRDIAAASGAPLASIPYHFGTKQALLDEALGVALARWREELAAIPVPPDPTFGLVASRLQAMLDSLPGVRPLAVALQESHTRAVHVEAFRTLLAAHRRAAMEPIATQLQALAKAQGREIDAEAAALAGLALMDGIIVHWLIDPDGTLPAARIVDGLRELLALGRTG